MTKALYYPTIDITNENWLKMAVLFWDEINTIVPESINNPYQEVSTQYLADEGILQPLRVNPEMDLIEDLTNDTFDYLNTNEGFQLLTQAQGTFSAIHREKLPYEIDRAFRVHNEKLPYLIREIIEERLDNRLCNNRRYRDNEWLYVDFNFANFYMTLLANKLSEINSIALLTDNSYSSNLADKARLNNQIVISQNKVFRNRVNQRPINLAQGLLTNLIVESIRISPSSFFKRKLDANSSLKKIIKFKQQHRDELGFFRTNLSKLTQNVSKEKPIEAIRQEIQDIYKDEFVPAYDNFKKALNGYGIKWVADTFMKVAVISTGTTAFLPTILGLSAPQALFAGAGISMTASLVSYNSDKRKIIRENPYSYLLAINNEL